MESGLDYDVGVKEHLCRLNDENDDEVVEVHLGLLNGEDERDEVMMSMFEVEFLEWVCGIFVEKVWVDKVVEAWSLVRVV